MKPKLSPQQRATLRVCASCEWIYRGAPHSCPKCGFASYGARYVYGDRAYRFEWTQEPWMNLKLAMLRDKLFLEITEANSKKPRHRPRCKAWPKCGCLLQGRSGDCGTPAF